MLIASFMFIQFMSISLGQTTYATVADGSWSTAGIWDNGVPPSPLPSSDSIIINHAVTYNVNQTLKGVMVVNANSSITGTGTTDLKIGKAAINFGELINYGSISVRNLEVKPKNQGVSTDQLPVLHNYGTISTSKDITIGNNNGAGIFNNYAAGTVSVGDNLTLNSFLNNVGTMTVVTKLINSGGTIDSCGSILTPTLEIHSNSGRPGTFECIQVCGPFGDPSTIFVDGTLYFDYDDANNNAPASEVSFNNPNTIFCSIAPLPVELVAFDASVVKICYCAL